MKRRQAAVFLAAVIGLAALWGSPGVESRAQSGEVGRFGVIAAYEDPAAARELGVGWERITFDWAAFQPGGPDDFEEAVNSEWLDEARQAGREVVGLIVHTPPWASSSGNPAAVPERLDLPVDDPDNVWAAFVRRLARQYARQGVHHWIIYDEPDVRLGEGFVQFEGDVADYARLLCVAGQAARAGDSRAVIHVAAMNWWVDEAAGREPYLARLVRTAGGGCFDVVTLRILNDTQSLWDVTARARAILEGAGWPDKTIWLETNATPTLDALEGVETPLFGITPAQQADFIVQAAAISYAAGIERVAVIRLVDAHDDDSPWGLVRQDGSRRPAFETYRTVIDLFDAPPTVTRYESPDADLIVLEQASRALYVMWARRTTPVQFQVSSPGENERAQVIDGLGRSRQVRSMSGLWPAGFVMEAPAALLDSHGFLTVAGSPRVLVMDIPEGFYRVVYATANGDTVRLK